MIKHWGWTCSLPSKSKRYGTKMGKHCPNTPSVSVGFTGMQKEGNVLQIYSTTMLLYFSVSHRGQLKSLSISQFGLAPHFRQVPVGIYNTFRARPSLSTALTLNASTTYLTDMIFFSFFHVITQNICIFKARHTAGLSITF